MESTIRAHSKTFFYKVSMKKIMFNDKFGLTDAVLYDNKNMTRRIVPDKLLTDAQVYSGGDIEKRNQYLLEHTPYKVGEVVAIAQNYKAAGYEPGRNIPLKEHGGLQIRADSLAGWTNKMFVRADLMPHHILITDIKVELLQDISDEDCLKEGIMKIDCVAPYSYKDANGLFRCYAKPQYAFAALIDKVSGKGTWDRNPYTIAYEFVLIR